LNIRKNSDQAGGRSSTCPAKLPGCDAELKNGAPYTPKEDPIISLLGVFGDSITETGR